MRLFIAIRLSDEMRGKLTEVQQIMQRQGVRGNFSRRENLHLTAAFIGEYSDPDQVLDVLDQISFEPFQIRLSGIGSFRGIWWAGIGDSPALSALVRRIRRALSEAGIPFDRKKFSPHITLIRRPSSRDGHIPEAALAFPFQGEMTVDHVSLMRSDRGKNGMIYTEL